MGITDILTFLAGLVSGSFLTLTFNYVRSNVLNNQGGALDKSNTKSDQRGSQVEGNQAGRDINK